MGGEEGGIDSRKRLVGGTEQGRCRRKRLEPLDTRGEK